MKKIVLLILGVICLAGCKEKENNTPVTNNSQSRTANNDSWATSEPEQQKIERTKGASLMISEGWTLCKENEDGTMSSAMQTVVGDEVSVIKENGSPVQKTADWKFQNGTRTKDINWVLVEYDENEYWTRDLFLADEGRDEAKIVVVTKESHVYSAADEMAMTKDTFEEGKNLVVCGWPSNNFYEVKIYNGKPYGKKVYIEETSASSNDFDIEMYTLAKKMNSHGDAKTDLKPEVEYELIGILEVLMEKKDSYGL